jgi:hypothetical protein
MLECDGSAMVKTFMKQSGYTSKPLKNRINIETSSVFVVDCY